MGCPIPILSANSSMPAFLCTSLCNAARVTAVQQTEQSLQCVPLVCPGFHFCVKLPVVWVFSGMNLCLAIFFVNPCISLNFGLLFSFQHLCNTVLVSGDILPSALHCLCQSPHGISFLSRKIGMEQKLNLLKLCHAPMEIYAQIHMRSYTAAQLLPAPSLNTVSTTVKFHDV